MLSIFLLWSCVASARDVDGRFTVEVYGNGPDIVLIPGLASSRDVWKSVQLGRNYRLHLVQLSGFAGLPPEGNAVGPILQPTVEALHHYLVEQKLKAPIVIGHSMGGLLAIMLASAHPDDVSKLVVVDALPFFGLLTASQTTVALLEPRAAMLRDMVATQSPDDFATSEVRSAKALATSPPAQALVAEWGSSSNQIVVAHSIYEDMTADVREKLPAITVPTLVLYPDDGTQPQTGLLYTSAFNGLPNKQVKAIMRSRHFIPLDQPEAFEAAVRHFLGEYPRN